MAKSFYDQEYIVELNEKREESLRDEIEKITSKTPTLFIIYSVVSFLLFPIIADCVEKGQSISWWYLLFLIVFGVVFLASLLFALSFIRPRFYVTLAPPMEYYKNQKTDLESNPSYQTGGSVDEASIDFDLLEGYISELQDAIVSHLEFLSSKQRSYKLAFFLGLISLLPYFGCIFFHMELEASDKKVTKVELVNTEKFRNLCCDSLKIIQYDTARREGRSAEQRRNKTGR